MLLSLISAILGSGLPGFVMSCLTTIIKGSEDRKMKKFDIQYAQLSNEHELKMLTESAKNQRELQSLKLEEISVQAHATLEAEQVKLDIERQKNLYVPVELNTKLNQFIGSVRPVVTYLFTIVFLSMYVFLAIESVRHYENIVEGLLEFLDTEFAKNMNYLFASVITFWFGNRMIDSKQGKVSKK